MTDHIPGILAVVGIAGMGVIVVWGARQAHTQNLNNIASQRWCEQACGANRVLLCEVASNGSWPAPRLTAMCVLDPAGSEFRVVVREGAQ